MASKVISQAARISSAMGPSVRNLLAHYKLDPSQIVSTGPHQTLLKSDVLSFIDQKNLQPGSGPGLSKDPEKKVRTIPNSSPTLNTMRPNSKVTVFHTSNGSNAKLKYARKSLTQLEIDVINNGGKL